MEITTSYSSGRLVLHLSGELDHHGARNALREVEQAIDAALPKKLVNIIHCKNPRCITVSEPQLDAIFLLSDAEKHTYRCAYCDTAKDKR